MSDRTGRPPRVLAPVALVAFVLAFLLVLARSDVEDQQSRPSASRSPAQAQPDRAPAKTDTNSQADGTTTGAEENEGTLPSKLYTVKPGDTLAGIAEKTGLKVEKLQALNPELDPQTLASGEKIKLQE